MTVSSYASTNKNIRRYHIIPNDDMPNKTVIRFDDENLTSTASDALLEILLDKLKDNNLLMEKDRSKIMELQEKYAGHGLDDSGRGGSGRG